VTPREPAEHQLERVLHAIPFATRPGGASLDELAEELGVPAKRVLADLEEVTARAYYLEPPLDIEISIEKDRVTVWTTGEFRRPVRLMPREALALTLGLRILAEGAEATRTAALRTLATRLDVGLASFPAEALAEGFALGAGDPAGGGALDLLREAARERRPCRLRYLKPADVEPEPRVLHPYALVHAGGRWYALGRSAEAGAVRAFRLDRVLDVQPLDGTFDVPAGFDPADHVQSDGPLAGGVFRADETLEATVRYAPRIARWIEERGAVTRRDGGAVEVRHPVADPGWLVRHVLYHGPDAEVVGPPEMRDLLRQRVEQIRIAQEEEKWSESARRS
jgi:proteasome accessory factor C